MRTWRIPEWVNDNYDHFVNRKKAKVMDYSQSPRTLERVSVSWGDKYTNPDWFDKVMVKIRIGDKEALIDREELSVWIRNA